MNISSKTANANIGKEITVSTQELIVLKDHWSTIITKCEKYSSSDTKFMKPSDTRDFISNIVFFGRFIDTITENVTSTEEAMLAVFPQTEEEKNEE
jgi:hypothetical protein